MVSRPNMHKTPNFWITTGTLQLAMKVETLHTANIYYMRLCLRLVAFGEF